MDAQLLPSLNQQLAEEIRRDGTLAAARFDLRHESMPPFLYAFPYAVADWPIFVNRRVIREQFEPLIAAVPRILFRALRAGFSDSGAMAEYFGWPEMICQIFVQEPVDPRDVLIRHDAVLDSGGLKLFENNMGTAVGGWQDDYFQRQMSPRLACLAQSEAPSFHYRPILPAMFKVIAGGIDRRKPGGSGGNFLVHHTFSPGGANMDDFRNGMQAVYDEVRPPSLAEGHISILRDFSEIGFTAAGEVTAHGRIMDALILGDALNTDMPPATLNRLIAAYLREQLVYPDSPFHLMLGDKGLFALLHECRIARLLDDDDRAFIERFIPWSARLFDQEVLRDGVRIQLIPHVIAHKNDFVIKKFQSSAGRDVFVGRHADAAEWERIIRDHMGTPARWIAQQFWAPSQMELPDAALGFIPHALIWGIFNCGGEYSGAYIRSHRGAGGQGVINSATGAVELPVFEAD